MGYAVDNVPGVRCVGPKTATKLILEYGDLEKALLGAATMKPSKLRDNLIEHAEMARLSRILVELKRDCPLPDPLDESEEHTSELQSLMRISYAVFCLKKQKNNKNIKNTCNRRS